jgi:cell division protein FtsQ
MADPRRSAVGLGLLVAGVVLLGAIAAALTYTPLFAASDIRVEGAQHRSDRDILVTAGLKDGINVFHMDGDAAEAALEEDPWIATATVTSRLPRTLVVHIEERRPAVIADEVVVAGDGTPLPGARLSALPVVRSSMGFLEPDDVSDAARAAAALDPGMRARVRYVIVGMDGQLELRLDDGLVVRWGNVGEDEAKATSLAAFLRYAEEHGRPPWRVDVSVPGAPSARFES